MNANDTKAAPRPIEVPDLVSGERSAAKLKGLQGYATLAPSMHRLKEVLRQVG